MEKRTLGPLGSTSILSLGGGGLGQLWGPTTRDECVATLRAAVDSGIDLIDMAPRYGNGEAEDVVGIAFGGRLPAGVRITTKCFVGQTPADEVGALIRRSLADSLRRMRLDRVDVLLLHSNVVPDDDPMSRHPDAGTRMTPYRVFVERVRPTFEALKAEGRIGHWGLTGIGYPDTIIRLLGEMPPPAVVQCIANPLDSAGSLKFTPGPTKPRAIIRAATGNGIGVMGIRAVQAGALTDVLDRPLPADHPEMLDYARAAAYRALAAQLGMSASDLGHRYALAMAGLGTVVLGVKNRVELAQCVAAANAGPLAPEIVARVDACFRPGAATP